MAEKILNTRILMKIDTLENWGTSTLKLKEGELAFATVAASAGNGLSEPVVMVKIGTAEEKTFSELPWAFHAKAADVLAACKSEESLTAFVNGVIANAGIATDDAMQELAGKVTTAEGKITTLEGEMDAVEKKAADNATAIETLQGLVGTDKNVATQIQDAINALNLADTYAAKSLEKTVSDHVADTVAHVTTADKTKWNGALQTSDIAAGSANGTIAVKGTDVAITGLGSAAFTESTAYDAAGAAATAESNAKTYAKEYADGLAGNYDAKGAAAAAESAAKTYADGLAGNYDAKGSAAQALTDANAYTDGEIAEWVGDKPVGTQITTAIDGLKLSETYDAKGAAAAVEGKLNTHVTEAAAAYETKTDASAKLTEAKGYTDTEVGKVQDEVDALETYVGTIPTDEKYADITNVVAYVNKKAEETLAAAQGGSSETAASVKQQLDNYKSENDTRVGAAEEAIDAIEADYLKAADKEELQGNIDTVAGDVADLTTIVGDGNVSERIADAVAAEAEIARAAEKANADAIDAIEADYLKAADKTELQNQINTIMNNPDTEGVINSINEFTQYIADHGAIAEGFRTDIDNNAKDIKAISDDYLKAEDKTALQGEIDAVEGRMDTAEGDIDALETAVGTKAAQADLETLAGRVTTAEGKITTLEGEMDQAQTDINNAEAAIEALQGLVSDKTVSEQIKDVTDPISEKVTALEGKAHEHANKTVLDGISADQVTAWDAAVQTVTPGTGLTATKTGTDVAIGFDDTVTFIFDCGDSTGV